MPGVAAVAPSTSVPERVPDASSQWRCSVRKALHTCGHYLQPEGIGGFHHSGVGARRPHVEGVTNCSTTTGPLEVTLVMTDQATFIALPVRRWVTLIGGNTEFLAITWDEGGLVRADDADELRCRLHKGEHLGSTTHRSLQTTFKEVDAAALRSTATH